MALAYYDRTLNSSYELVLAGLRESSNPTSLLQLSTFVTRKTGYPREVCYRIIVEALEEGMASKSIRQVGELYCTVPSKPPRLPARRKWK
ncbi:hypothetical protein KR009_002561, partial [Drosophila setifemur]